MFLQTESDFLFATILSKLWQMKVWVEKQVFFHLVFRKCSNFPGCLADTFQTFIIKMLLPPEHQASFSVAVWPEDIFLQHQVMFEPLRYTDIWENPRNRLLFLLYEMKDVSLAVKCFLILKYILLVTIVFLIYFRTDTEIRGILNFNNYEQFKNTDTQKSPLEQKERKWKCI